jgi:RNA polymerase sigma-70 factor, ECF subfamily
MPTNRPEDLSQLLIAWNEGRQEALKELMPIVCPELRRIARRQPARRFPNQTLESAALVNEAYLKLVRARGIRCDNRSHFFALCAQMIRRILVDHLRQNQGAKRGRSLVHVTAVDEELLGSRAAGVEVLALDEALTLLFQIDPRKVRVVEMRFFGGLTVEEASEVLGISPETVKRDWRFAKTWLVRQLRRARTSPDSAS